LEGELVGGGDVAGHRGATRVGVLDDGGGGAVAEVVHNSPRGGGIEEVEVRQRHAAVLDDAVPPARAADLPVPGALLVGVLAVPELVVGALEGEVDGGWQGLAVAGGVVEPGGNGGVVGGRMGEGAPGQPPASVVREPALTSQLVEDGAVVGRV